ncbi:family 78 glycoside hydrolase catalytic domain [Paenibacillus silvae]|uniref:family 78 glycoside hydrolase catalytic domain n=1 Tax=Paenibacillus silvae TaxID=1325358 RepID=UPI003CF18844
MTSIKITGASGTSEKTGDAERVAGSEWVTVAQEPVELAKRYENESKPWLARWITRSACDPADWISYQVEVSIYVETVGASFLFGYQDEQHHCGVELDCNLNEQETEHPSHAHHSFINIYRIEEGVRHTLGEFTLPQNAEQSAYMRLKINTIGDDWQITINEQQTYGCKAAPYRGRVGFRTKDGQKAIFRDLKLTGSDGRVLYSNRFYDPHTTHCSAGTIHASGNGLVLEENMLSICNTPVPVDSPLFRKTIVLPSPPIEARLRIYSLGWYELYINGERSDHRVLAPANTPYKRRMLYDTYDVTELLHEKENVLGVWLGNGYYFNYSRWGWKWNRDKALILQLDLRFEDGSTQTIVTDESWSCAPSPILANDIYDGESYDARLEYNGWNRPGFITNHDWSNAVTADSPEGELVENHQPPITTFTPLKPVAVFHPRPGVNVYDFGQNIAGWARIQVKGQAGSEVRLRYSELVDETGDIDPWTNRNAKAADTYILHGDGEEHYEPRFTYHGFRYLEVSAGSSWVSIEAVPIHTDVEQTGTFESSDERLNQLYRNIRWSYLNNLMSIPTDCCQRDERTPCLMDSAVVEESGMHHFNMQRYYRKWLDDIEDSMTNPDWSGDKVSLPWYLYQHYNDLDALSRSYPSMKAYINHLHEKWPEHVVKDGFGDWCPPNEDGWENYFHEVELVNTSVYYKITSITAEAAAVLGIDSDHDYYRKLADHINQAFQRRFHSGDGIYGSGSQTAQLLPLAYGMVPVKQRVSAANRLVQSIAEKNGHLDTGIYGTRYVLDVLADYGHIDVAYALLSKKEYPGFGYQIERGATTLWEQWSEKGGMHSHDHAMFGGISASFYTRLAGIRPDAPGYQKIWIEPCIPSKLSAVSASLRTSYGLISSSWKKQDAGLQLQVEIPEGTTATLVLPSVMASAAKLSRIHELAPGRHHFTLSFQVE